MKLTFGIIVLNGDFLLKPLLESIYSYAHAICIAEGSVEWFYENGVYGSTDNTLKIIREFPDPQNKITLVSSTYREKDEQCRAWFAHVPEDTDYIICNDADEIHSPENLELLIKYLEMEQPTSVGFKSDSFYGGFDRIIGGFEREHSFKRVLKYEKGSVYRTHRQPTLSLGGKDIDGKDISGNQLYEATGITMWHGSYVSPFGVFDKIKYYEAAVISEGNCIPDYFYEVFLPWVTFPERRIEIEDKWNGVQEFMPHARGECKTIPYEGKHPAIIKRDLLMLRARVLQEVEFFNQKA